MIKNIVFDFGGVIVDIDRDKAVQAFIKLGLADADTRLDKYHQTGITIRTTIGIEKAISPDRHLSRTGRRKAKRG